MTIYEYSLWAIKPLGFTAFAVRHVMLLLIAWSRRSRRLKAKPWYVWFGFLFVRGGFRLHNTFEAGCKVPAKRLTPQRIPSKTG
jgi:hypothetical protein